MDENVQTWWKAKELDVEPWLCLDLETCDHVHVVQINFADDMENRIDCPGSLVAGPDMERYIDCNIHPTRWLLEGSADGRDWTVLADKRQAQTDLPHDYVVFEDGIDLRFIKLTIIDVPYHVLPSVSGIRVFGNGDGKRPEMARVQVEQTDARDMVVSAVSDESVCGYNILWGHAPGKLYHSCMVMGACQAYKVGALVEGQSYYVRVDAFNKNGITHGKEICLPMV